MAAPDRWRCWRGACPSGRTLRARRPGCRRRRARMPWAAGWGRPGGVTSRCARLHAAYRLHRTHASTHAASRAWTALPCPDGQCMRDGARCTRVSVPCANLYQRDAHLCQALWRTKRKDFAKQQAQAPDPCCRACRSCRGCRWWMCRRSPGAAWSGTTTTRPATSTCVSDPPVLHPAVPVYIA